jgi:hypothetical protein
MPSREFDSAAVATLGVGTTLLRKHKPLPHPRARNVVMNGQIYTPSPPRVLSIETGVPSSPSTHSPSSPRTLKHASRRIGLPEPPPTPPTHSRQSSNGQSYTYEATESDTATKTSVPTTPTNPQSPPTPDVTPPRASEVLKESRPPITHRWSSSRNDSFKTAREDLSSEEDEVGFSTEDDLSTVRPTLSSSRPSEAEVPQIKSEVKRREVGLGLDLESEDDKTPSPRTSRGGYSVSQPRTTNAFLAFDGEYGSSNEGQVEREWDHNLMRNVSIRKGQRRLRHTTRSLHDSPSGEVIENNQVTPTPAGKLARQLPLHEEVNGVLPSKTAVDRSPVQDSPEWSGFSVRDTPEFPDVRRFSTMSARSQATTIEAMVIDAPPQRRRTLRHTKKQIGLREFAVEHNALINGVQAEQPRRRLVHKKSGTFERRHLSVVSTNTTTSMDSAKARKEVIKGGAIPVVLVPQRTSSKKSARTPSLRSTSSHRTKDRSLSLGSAPPSSSTRTHESGYFDIPKRNPRRLSGTPSASGGDSGPRTMDFPPVVPVRRSSLSAPTSRNTSRAGSLTAESLRAHNELQAQIEKQMERKPASQRPELVQLPPSSESHKDPALLSPKWGDSERRPSVDQNGDPFFGTRSMTQATPFSQRSYETSLTAAEVAQATSVALYPHKNDSLVLVNHSGTSSRSTRQIAEEVLAQPEVGPTMLDCEPLGSPLELKKEPATPPQPIPTAEETADVDVDSPLRNPRSAPLPPIGAPAIKFIPPTPGVLTPAQEDDRQLGHNGQIYGPVSPSAAPAPVADPLLPPTRKPSLLRRVLNTTRRNSISNVTRNWSTRGNRDFVDDGLGPRPHAHHSDRIPSVGEQPADASKLHPFWRPARFWDDLDDDLSDPEYDDERFSPRDRYPPLSSRNRPGLPKRSLSEKLKRTFAILPIRDFDDAGYGVYEVRPSGPERRTVRRAGPNGELKVVKARGSSGSLRRAVSDSSRSGGGSNYLEGGRSYYTTVVKQRPGPPQRGNSVGGMSGGMMETMRGLGRRLSLSERRREKGRERLRGQISGPTGVVDGVAQVVGVADGK